MRSLVSRREMVATPFTRPPGSDSTTSPSTWDPRGARVMPSITMGSAKVPVNLSPLCVLLVESVVSVRILMGVPAAMVTDGGFCESGKSAFAGAASEAGVESVAADCSAVLLHPARDTAMAVTIHAALNLVLILSRCARGPKRNEIIALGRCRGLIRGALDLHQGLAGFSGHRRLQRLLAAPEIEVRDVVHTAYRTVGCAGLFGEIFAVQISLAVLVQRFRRIAALLRAIVHQPVLANVHVARSCTALPIVRLPLRDGVLEITEPGEAPVLHGLHLVIHAPLAIAQRAKLAIAIVDDSNRRLEPQFHGAAAHHQGVFRIMNPAAHH